MKYSALLLLCIPLMCIADEPKEDGYHYKPAVGWYWYNQPKKNEERKQEINPESSSPPSSYSEVMQKLHAKREELLNKAILTGNDEDVIRYKQFQDFLVGKVSTFSSRWESALLSHPELDYNLKHPVYNGAAPIEYAAQRKKQAEAINYINQKYGVFFFYRGNEPLDNKLGSVVKEFSQQYGIPFIAVTVDGRVNPDLPDSRQDQGQSARMQIIHFPAIFLVEPIKQTYKPLSYGFITQDDLARRVLNVVTDFKPID